MRLTSLGSVAPLALQSALKDILQTHSVPSISVATDAFDLVVGEAVLPETAATPGTWFQQASLSKTVASAFALELFALRGLALDSPVAEVLGGLPGATHFGLEAAAGAPAEWVGRLTLRMLMDHTGLGMHYVSALDSSKAMPASHELLNGYGDQYPALRIAKEPGKSFGYSGGGFLVLQYLVEQLTGQDIETATRHWLDAVGLHNFSFAQQPLPQATIAHGYTEAKTEHSAEVGRFWFPPFAAGGVGTSRALMDFLTRLASAYHDPTAEWPMSHTTARTMLTPNPAAGVQEGCMDFMSCKVGVGTFIAECGPNSVALHQAANEGFRGVYAVVFDGPDRGRGAVILSNGDNNAMLANARALQELLLLDGWGRWQGVSTQYLQEHKDFDSSGISQEQIVNKGYKELVFRAFASQEEFSEQQRA